MRSNEKTCPGRTAEAGFTLIEIIMAGTILAIAACGLSGVLVSSMTVSTMNKETAQARGVARQMLEQLQNIPVGDVYATFNDITTDDPLGENTAPGGLFNIKTKPATVQVSNMTGEIMFPGFDDKGELREDLKDEALGMPRDLNGDGLIDSENHSHDFLVLPVRIRIRWRGFSGERTLDICSLLLNA